MSSETPRMRSRWAASMTAASAWRKAWLASRFSWAASKRDLLDRAFELRLHPLAGVQGHNHRVLAHDLLALQAGRLLFLMGGDVVIGQGLQERAAIGPELFVGESVLDRSGIVPGFFFVESAARRDASSATSLLRLLISLRSSGIRSATFAAISDFQLASNWAVTSSRCFVRGG